ncbi:MAG: 2-amino-4-hydroxy-6-hydroxymethyldihydropteridine diphosphokinase [Thermoleophilaceae bacterium]
MRGFLGLGSNVGDRHEALRAARGALDGRHARVIGSSSVYETAPQGQVLHQPDFLNAVLEIETDLEPEALLDACKQVEQELGRITGGRRHGPRLIDVDVLLLGALEQRSERLTLPHPEVSVRRFVLDPLLELHPDLTLPDGTALVSFRAAVVDQPVRRAGPF